MSQTKGQNVGRQLVPSEERRRSQRVILRVGVTVYVTHQGRTTKIIAFTVSVNDHGALLLLPQTFVAGTRLMLEHNRTRQQQSCRVTRTPQRLADGFHVPVEFEKPAPNFWHIVFPPTDWTDPEK